MPYSGTLYICFSSSTGLSPCAVRHSRQLRIEKLRLKTGPATPHLLTVSSRIQFAVCCVHSLLLAASQLISFPSGTVTFHFPELKILSDRSVEQEVSFGNLWFNGCMRLARAFRSLPRPSSPLEPSHPPYGIKDLRDYCGSFLPRLCTIMRNNSEELYHNP